MVVGVDKKKRVNILITFIRGRSGRGKTQFLFEDIKKKLTEKTNEAIYILVPDQMSFQTEYALLQQLEKGAMMRVEVVGLSRFVTQMIQKLQPKEYTVFDTLAQKMLLQQVALQHQEQLEIYKNALQKPEFIDYLHQFSRQLRGTGIELEDVQAAFNFTKSQPLLSQKLVEIATILEAYAQNVNADLFDNADKMQYYLELLKDPIHQAKLADIHIYVDGYYTFNNLETEVVTASLRYSKSAMMTFCVPETLRANEHSLFALTERQYRKIATHIGKANYQDVVLSGNKARFHADPLLDYIEQHYETPKPLPTVLRQYQDYLQITEYRSIEQEVIQTAQKIRKLLIDGKLRAQEIAVYLPQKEKYVPYIEKYFNQYEIPYYLDMKESMLGHPVFQWLHILLQVVHKNWQIEDILALVHNDFFRYLYQIDDDVYYLFIDFVERIRFPYKSIWQNDKYWNYYDMPQQLTDSYNEAKTAQLNVVRKAIVSLITEFETLLDVSKTTKTAPVLQAIFSFIQKQPIYQYIETNAALLTEAKYLAHVTEKQYQESIWKALIHIFEQAYLALGSQDFLKPACLQALLFGLEQAEFTSVPLGFDVVMIGDFARTRFQTLHQENSDTNMGVQYAFILGLLDTTMPYAEKTIQVLSNHELAFMREHQILEDILLQDEAIRYQLFHFYTMVTSAAKAVYLSFYRYSGKYLEEEHRISAVVENTFLTHGFQLPLISQVTTQNQLEMLPYLTLPVAKAQVVANYTTLSEESSLVQVVRALDPNFFDYLQRASQYKNEVNVHPDIPVPKIVSLTQIETYNRCPYQYFLKYVLRIKEPVSEGIQTFQTGQLLHNAYELLAQQAVDKGIKLSDIHQPEQYMEQYFTTTETQLTKHPLFQMDTNRFIFNQARQVAVESLRYILENEAKATFIPQHLEYDLPYYGVSIRGIEKYIRGKLDRIDVDTTGNYFRIVDYKSSARDVDFNKLLHGIQLQLPFYSFLASEHFKEQLAGSMYVPVAIKDVSQDSENNVSDSEIQKLIQKNYKASGLYLDNRTSLEKFDITIATNGQSEVIQYKEKKDGTADQHASVLSDGEFATLHQFAHDMAVNTLEAIETRDFEVKPLRRNLNNDDLPCKYCPFRSICQFDQKVNCYNDKKDKVKGTNFAKKKAEFFEEIAKGDE